MASQKLIPGMERVLNDGYFHFLGIFLILLGLVGNFRILDYSNCISEGISESAYSGEKTPKKDPE